MKVAKVTQTDIKRGVRESCSSCPLAIALKKTLKTSFVEVFVEYAIINEVRYRIDTAVSCILRLYDNTSLIRPFTVKVDGYHKTIKLRRD